MDVFVETIQGIIQDSGFMAMTWQQGVMILISFVLFFLAIAKKFEPLLLLPIAFGMFLANIPLSINMPIQVITVALEKPDQA